MKIKALLLISAAVIITACSTVADAPSAIKVKVPERPAGQQDVIGLTVPAMDTVRVGFVGIGARGLWAVKRYTYVPGIKITALCDAEPDRVENAQKMLSGRGFPKAAEYSGDTEAYKKLCERDDVDLVYVCTDWASHAEIGVYAMEHGKNVAIEVPAATTLDEIWNLINTSERTRKHCIMLENCTYDFFELSCLAMAQAGVFGDIVHVDGSYLHYLNTDTHWKRYWRNWRLEYNQTHRGDLYPTHGLGPLCQILNIHRGDRMKTLVAMDSKSVSGNRRISSRTGKDYDGFVNGDETNTLIRTENGVTISIAHDVMTPRPYNRTYQIVGSDGFAQKYPIEQLCFKRSVLENADSLKEAKIDIDVEKNLSDEEIAAMKMKYPNPILTPELKALAKKVGGHGGMDFIMDYRLIYCLRNGLPLDMDVYDMAEWCCIIPLSALSIENGNVPVEIPDFTRGGLQKTKGFHYAFAK